MKKNLGFSLIELLVSIVIIGILTALSIPTFNNWQNRNEYRQAIDKIVGMMNTVRINTQSEKQCVFQDDSIGSWMISLAETEVVIGCYSASHTPNFEEKLETRFSLNMELIDDKIMFFEQTENFSWDSPVKVVSADATTPLRVFWQKDENDFETVLLQSLIVGNTDLVSVPANDVSINYEYIDTDYTRSICLNRIAGYPYISKNVYDYSNPASLCTE